MKPFRLKVRVYNNRLIRAREELGLTQSEAAERMGVAANYLSALETLRPTRLGKAWRSDGWTLTARRIAAFYGLSPEYLWPDEIAAIRKNALQLEVAASDLHVLAGGEVDRDELLARVNEAKRLLPPAEQTVIDAWTNGATLEQIGDERELSRERIRQILGKGLRGIELNMRRAGTHPEVQ